MFLYLISFSRGTQVITRIQTQQPVISLQPNHQHERTIWTDGIWWSIPSTRHHHHSLRMLNTGLALCLSMPRRNEGLILACWVKRILWYIYVLQCTETQIISRFSISCLAFKTNLNIMVLVSLFKIWVDVLIFTNLCKYLWYFPFSSELDFSVSI